MMSLWWQTGVAGIALLLAACGNRAAEAPAPGAYDWPRTLRYEFETSADSGLAGPASDQAERFGLSLEIRDENYLVRSAAPAGLAARDTVPYLVALGPRGEIGRSAPLCDPVEASCAAAFPSRIRLTLHRLVPRLSIWPPPHDGTWVDTVRFDDFPRSGGWRGELETRYSAAPDTTVRGVVHWLIFWRSVLRLSGGANGSSRVELEEAGMTMIEKARLIPTYSSWTGEATVGGVRGSYTGRARLTADPPAGRR